MYGFDGRSKIRLAVNTGQIVEGLMPGLFTTGPDMSLRVQHARILERPRFEADELRRLGVFMVYAVAASRAKPAARDVPGGGWPVPLLEVARENLEPGASEDHRDAERAGGEFLAVETVAAEGSNWLLHNFVGNVAALATAPGG